METETINNLDYKSRNVLILGVKRTGKSTLASRLIETHPAPLVLVYDWQGGEFAKRLNEKGYNSREDVGTAIAQDQRIICYNAEKGEAKSDIKTAGFDWFCDMSFEVAGRVPGRKLFVVDECHDLIDPYNIPEPLGDILGRGGRRMMDTCIIGASANCMHGESRNQVSELFVFRCVDDNALKYPKSIGLDDDAIRALPDCRFLCWDARTGEKKELELWGGKRSPS
jgi:hypothetical protein